MKTIAKMAAGALIACGATLAVAAPANAGVRTRPWVLACRSYPLMARRRVTRTATRTTVDIPPITVLVMSGPIGADRGYWGGYGARGYWSHAGWRPAVRVGVGHGFGHVGFGGARRL